LSKTTLASTVDSSLGLEEMTIQAYYFAFGAAHHHLDF